MRGDALRLTFQPRPQTVLPKPLHGLSFYLGAGSVCKDASTPPATTSHRISEARFLQQVFSRPMPERMTSYRLGFCLRHANVDELLP